MNAIKCNDIKKTLELFDEAKREAVIPKAQAFTKALYLMLLNNQHDELDNLYQDMCNYGYLTEEGAKMTVIRSYVSRRMFKIALRMLDNMETNIHLKHTRSYNPVIKGLAENGLTHEAFQLFHRKLKMSHCVSKGSENVTNDVEMFIAMIKSCHTVDSLQIPIYGNINNQGFTKSSTRSVITDDEKQTIKSKHLLVYQLFQFIYEFGIKFTPKLIKACKEWSLHDESHTWTWRYCSVNSAGKCTSCGTTIRENLPGNYFKNLENELISLFSGETNSFHLSPNKMQDLSYVNMLCKENGPFDVIIDAQNIGLDGKRKGESSSYSTEIYEKRMVKVVEHFSKLDKKIFLPLHIKAVENDISGNLLTFLRNHCEVQALKSNINEDLVLLYAASLSGLDKTCIVTNDNLRDHSALISQDNHWKLLKWTRLNHITFKLSHKNKLKFHKNLFDPKYYKKVVKNHRKMPVSSQCPESHNIQKMAIQIEYTRETALE
ncbi:hypothetical protein AC249_AIPGENE27345 [Exaiptasia diaphana]|nr:hypothetical protein AC249_AIPGENE27345 [Exaiptasia diaphana]